MPSTCTYIFTDKTCGKKSPCCRPTRPGSKLCIFHTPIHQKSEKVFQDEFQKELDAAHLLPPKAAMDYRGFIFPKIDLKNAKFPVEADFRAAIFTEQVDFRGAIFLSQADFYTAEFEKNANFFGVIFRTNVRFLGSKFHGRAVFNGSKFLGSTTFCGCKFLDFAAFQSTKFDKHLIFHGNEFVKDADFRGAIYYDGVEFTKTLFRGRANFEGARFHGEVCLAETHLNFLKKMHCRHADMRGAVLHTAQIWENEILSYYDFRGSFLLSVNLSGKQLRDCDFTGAVFRSVLTVGWRLDSKTLANTKYIYTDYISEERVGEGGRKYRTYAPVPDSRVPAEGEFGVGEHAEFNLATYLREPVKVNMALSVPPLLRTAVSNYLQLFSDFVKVTQGIPVELRTRLEGTKLRVEFLADSEDDLTAIRESFTEYQEASSLDFEQLKLKIRFATGVGQLEQDLFLMKLESQLNQLRTELTYTKALLTKSEENKDLLLQVLAVSRTPSSLLQPLALPTPPATVVSSDEDASTLRLVFSYSHKDEELRDQLDTHLAALKRKGTIGSWHDRKITPGREWDPTINHEFATADIVLLLISSDFLSSDYCIEQELSQALQRHENGDAVVIPVCVRSCDWSDAPFGKIQGLPRDMKPVTSWTDRDEAWTDVSRGIRKAAEDLLELRLRSHKIKDSEQDGAQQPLAR